MNHLFYIVVISGVISCCGSKNKPQPPREDPRISELKAKVERYLDLAETNVDSLGWIKDTKCDGLLFNSLFSIAGGHPDIEAAQEGPGIWYRFHTHDCYSGGGSGSTISRDMFIGLFLWIWHNKRLDLIEDIIQYGEAHTNALGGWVMGEGDKFRISIRGSGQATAYEMRYRLGGSNHWKRKIPQVWPRVKDYEAHLQVLHILLRAHLTGGVRSVALRALRGNAEREPRNALFVAVYNRFKDGDRSAAIESLLDETIFPSDRLPVSSDRCTFYLWQREVTRDGEPNPDWLPCKERSEVFTGIDFLFGAAIVLNKI